MISRSMRLNRWSLCLVAAMLAVGTLSLPSMAQTKITVWVGSQTNEMLAWLAGFQEAFNRANPDIDLEIVNQGAVSAMRDKVITSSAAGVGPDLYTEGTNVLLMYVANGLALPLDRFLDASGDRADFLPDILRDVTFGGQLYALPYMMRPIADAYNLNLFESAGAPLPNTWNEMVEVVRRLNRVDAEGNVQVSGLGGSFSSGVNTIIRFQMLLEQLGTTMIEPGGTEVTMNTPEARRALEYMAEVFRAGVPDGRDRTVSHFLAGNVGVMHWVALGHPSWVDPVRSADLDQSSILVRRYVGPDAGRDSVHYLGSAYLINATSRHPEEAWRVLQALTSRESMKSALMAHGYELPTRVSLFADPDLLSRPWAEEALSVTTPPLSPFGANHVHFTQFRVEAGEILTKAVQGEIPLPAALEEAERISNGILRGLR